jgi:FMN phosphatase YigB (HAD superfamily)
MRHAKEAGLVVGAVCNAYHRYVDNNLPLLGLHQDLDFSVLSYELNVAKPSPQIYEAAVRRASSACRLIHGAKQPPIMPAEVLHVGDDLHKDFLAARACGMRALLLDPTGDVRHEELGPADVVRSLADVPARVDDMLVLHD